jgi:hypothetical protein
MNGWQRIWVVFSIISFILTTIISINTAPNEDLIVIKNIGMEDCSYLLKMPDGFKLENAPEYNSTCYELEYLRYSNIIKLNNLDDYRSIVLEQKIEFHIQVFVGWLISILTLYALGWSVAWIIKGFKKPSSNNA